MSYGYDPETRAQSSQWKTPNSPRAKKTRISWSSMKTHLTVFFYYRGWGGVVHHGFAPAGQKVKQKKSTTVTRCGFYGILFIGKGQDYMHSLHDNSTMTMYLSVQLSFWSSFRATATFSWFDNYYIPQISPIAAFPPFQNQIQLERRF